MQGEILKDFGMNAAIQNACSDEPDWKEQAIAFVAKYPKTRFQTEDIRNWAYTNGLVRPPSDRAWGSVIVEAKKQNMIVFDGYEKVSNPKAHRTPACVWRKM